MKVLLIFYEDREEKGEKNIEVREEKKENVFMSKSIRFQTFFCVLKLPFILPDLTYFIRHRRGRDVIS